MTWRVGNKTEWLCLHLSLCETQVLSYHSLSVLLFCYLFHAPPQKYFGAYYILTLGFPSGSVAQNLPAMQEPWETGSMPGSGRFPGGRHGNPLQYSCLENPTDRGTWQATVHSIAKTRTWLKQLFIHTYTYFTLNISTCFILIAYNLNTGCKSASGLSFQAKNKEGGSMGVILQTG